MPESGISNRTPPSLKQEAAQFVHRPVQQVGAQHHADGLFVVRQKPGAGDGLKYAFR